MHCLLLALFFNLARHTYSQQIWDIWETRWDKSTQFKSLDPSTPINFGTPGTAANPDVSISTTKRQTILGFGSTITDSSATIMANLKSSHSQNYWDILGYTFAIDHGAAGASYIRVPIGASDFSASVYSLDDSAGDTSFSKFSIDKVPSNVFTLLKDILGVNSKAKVNLVPWSPPGWMKDSGTMNGGSLSSNMVSSYPTYLLKAVQGFQSKGIPIYSISIQNEPQNSQSSYPSCLMSVSQMATIGKSLRTLLNNNGLGSVKIIGFEHNWDTPNYPVQLLQAAPDAFAGVAYHCYAGSPTGQDAFANAYPNKEIHFTECTGQYGGDEWSDLKWYIDNIFIGSLEHNAITAAMWNFALDGNGNPMLPGTASCNPPCRPLVTVNSDGSYRYNPEWYAMAHASKASTPVDSNGPTGKRLSVSISGSQAWTLRAAAFVTERASSSDWDRIALVVLNWNDNSSSGWNPVAVKATIGFGGKQATYTFPVGVTTLWFYADPSVAFAQVSETADDTVPTQYTQHQFTGKKFDYSTNSTVNAGPAARFNRPLSQL